MSSDKERSVSRRGFLRMAGLGGGALVLSACGTTAAPTSSGGPSASTAAPASGGSSQTLKIALFGTEVGAGDKATTDSFKAKHPGVEIEFMPLQGRDHEEYFSKILAQIAAGRVPDMTTIATEGTQLFAGQGLGHPLDDYVKRDAEAMKEYFADVHPSLVEAMMYEGSLYTLPNDFNAANMYFNMSLLKEAGLELPKED